MILLRSREDTMSELYSFIKNYKSVENGFNVNINPLTDYLNNINNDPDISYIVLTKSDGVLYDINWNDIMVLTYPKNVPYNHGTVSPILRFSTVSNFYIETPDLVSNCFFDSAKKHASIVRLKYISSRDILVFEEGESIPIFNVSKLHNDLDDLIFIDTKLNGISRINNISASNVLDFVDFIKFSNSLDFDICIIKYNEYLSYSFKEMINNLKSLFIHIQHNRGTIYPC